MAGTTLAVADDILQLRSVPKVGLHQPCAKRSNGTFTFQVQSVDCRLQLWVGTPVLRNLLDETYQQRRRA